MIKLQACFQGTKCHTNYSQGNRNHGTRTLAVQYYLVVSGWSSLGWDGKVSKREQALVCSGLQSGAQQSCQRFFWIFELRLAPNDNLLICGNACASMIHNIALATEHASGGLVLPGCLRLGLIGLGWHGVPK